MNTINGNELEEVLKAIREPMSKNRKLENGYQFYDISEYEKRIDDVVGIGHYETRYGDVKNMVLSAQQVVLSTTCEILLIGDAREIVYRANGIGTLALTYSTTNNEFIGLDNAGYLVQLQAFKSACKSMQIFDIHGVANESGAAGKNESVKDDSSRKKEGSSVVTSEIFYTKTAFDEVKKDTRSDKPIYKIYGNRVVNDMMEERESAIVFYPNIYKKDIEMINNYIALCSDGQMHKLEIDVTRAASQYQTSDAVQYVFKGFTKK